MARGPGQEQRRVAIVTPERDIDWLSRGLADRGFATVLFPLPDTDEVLRETEAALRRAPVDAIVYDIDPASPDRIDMLHRLRALPVVRDLPSLILTSEPELLYRNLGGAMVYEVILERQSHPHVIARALTVLLEERDVS